MCYLSISYNNFRIHRKLQYSLWLRQKDFFFRKKTLSPPFPALGICNFKLLLPLRFIRREKWQPFEMTRWASAQRELVLYHFNFALCKIWISIHGIFAFWLFVTEVDKNKSNWNGLQKKKKILRTTLWTRFLKPCMGPYENKFNTSIKKWDFKMISQVFVYLLRLLNPGRFLLNFSYISNEFLTSILQFL